MRLNKDGSVRDERLVNPIRYNKHIRRQNNHIVAAMFAMYKSGKSLEDIARVYKRSRQAIYDVFRTRGYQLRSKQLKGLQILDGIKFSLTKGGHLRGTVKGNRIMMHHYVWIKHHGKVPSGYCIWHMDRNPQNNRIENLEMLPKDMMSKYFNPEGRNQFSKNGIQISTSEN